MSNRSFVTGTIWAIDPSKARLGPFNCPSPIKSKKHIPISIHFAFQLNIAQSKISCRKTSFVNSFLFEFKTLCELLCLKTCILFKTSIPARSENCKEINWMFYESLMFSAKVSSCKVKGVICAFLMKIHI